MGFLGFANVYAMRVNLSVAIVSMVNRTAVDENNGDDAGNGSDVCKMHAANNGSSGGAQVDGMQYSSYVFCDAIEGANRTKNMVHATNN